MATSSLYYIDSSSFNTAVSVYTNQELTIKAPDGYYSIGGLYRRQIFGKLQELISCTGDPLPVDCVVSEWSEWSECIEGSQTRTRTVITPASNGGVACPSLIETQECIVVQCNDYTISGTDQGQTTYLDCDGIEQVARYDGIGASGFDATSFCASSIVSVDYGSEPILNGPCTL